MSLAADALQPHLTRGFISLRGRSPKTTLPDLLIGDRTGYDLDFDLSPKRISVDFRDTKPILAAMASDCCRFISASFQSVTNVANDIEQKDTLAWGMIRLYYSAFYSAHALIRMLGESCSYFDRAHIERINLIAEAIGKPAPFPLEKGLYHCVINQSATGITCAKVAGKNTASHEAFWGAFIYHLDCLTTKILSGPLPASDAQLVFSKLDQLKKSIKSSRSPDGVAQSLSSIRNNIQYRHQYGAWFQVGISQRDREQYSRLARKWDNDPMNVELPSATDDPIKNFIKTTIFIVALSRSMIIRVAERSSVGERCFAAYGPLAYLREANLFE